VIACAVVIMLRALACEGAVIDRAFFHGDELACGIAVVTLQLFDALAQPTTIYFALLGLFPEESKEADEATRDGGNCGYKTLLKCHAVVVW
jgi:hypothetical protein